VEHRYYGESLPYGDQSFTNENLKHLSVQQAMLDYLDVIQSFIDTFQDKTRRATIAAGGSYGGILAAWMRMKFPDKV
jgi:pimeloyl-ACP methyl ester carboxylesterase